MTGVNVTLLGICVNKLTVTPPLLTSLLSKGPYLHVNQPRWKHLCYDCSLLKCESMLCVWLMYRIKSKNCLCAWLQVCVYMHAHGHLQVDSAACYVTEGELLRIWPSSWHLLTPSWWGSQINTLLTSNLYFAGRKVHANTAWPHIHSPSKSSLTLPMVLHDRLQAALMNTHTKPN